jgi:hypothetical protein
MNMKRFLNYLLAIVVITIGLTACEKGLEPYHGNSGIYFKNNKTTFVDSGLVTFGFSDPSVRDTIIDIPVSAMGMTSTTDRPFKLVVNDNSTAKAGVHYDALFGTSIPAGAVGTTIKLKLHRTPDLQAEPVCLILQLLPNEHFQTDTRSFSNGSTTISATRYKLWVNDLMSQPKYWQNGYMGAFSRKKVYLTASVLGLNVQEMIDILNGTDGTVALNAQIAWGRSMKLYLNQQAAAGTPVKEDNGSLMVMGNLI